MGGKEGKILFPWRKNASASTPEQSRKTGRWRTRLKVVFSGVSLVDRCLLVFMLILLLQSAYRIFVPGGDGDRMGDIDIIVRTSSAAIFGYFLSANFMCHTPRKSRTAKNDPIKETDVELEGGTGPTSALRGPIGFAAEPQPELELGGASTRPAEVEQEEKKKCAHLQVAVAAGIGLFCLLTLIVLRDLVSWPDGSGESSSVTATIVQFRDFVSGCVGFLIGSPGTGTEEART